MENFIIRNNLMNDSDLQMAGGGFLFVDGLNGVFTNMTELTNVWQGTNYQTANIVKEGFKLAFKPVENITGGIFDGEIVYDLSKVGLGIKGGMNDVFDFMKQSKTLTNITIFTGKSVTDSAGIYFDGKTLFDDLTLKDYSDNKDKEAGAGK